MVMKQQLLKLKLKREAYIAKNSTEEKGELEKAMTNAIKKQASSKSIEIK